MLIDILLMRMMVMMTSMPGAKSEDRAVSKAFALGSLTLGNKAVRPFPC